MAVSEEYKRFVADILEDLGSVRIKNMFGGSGVYYGDLMFGLIASETLYFKVDAQNRADFEEEDMEPFYYEPANGKKIAMSFWEIPPRLFDESDELTQWARKSVDAAHRAKQAKPKRKKAAAKKKAKKAATKK